MAMRYLKICALGIAALGCGSCSRSSEDAIVVDLPAEVQSIQEESDRRRPTYRDAVERHYPAIAGKRKREWVQEWGPHRLRSTD